MHARYAMHAKHPNAMQPSAKMHARDSPADRAQRKDVAVAQRVARRGRDARAVLHVGAVS
eukprot:1193802-Pleurochrysis_carterae.AAC.1